MNPGKKKYMIILFIFILSAGVDRITKIAAKDYLEGKPAYTYLGDTFRLQYTENTGAMLGVGGQLPETTRFYLFTVGVGLLLLLGLLYILLKPVPTLPLVAYSLIISGGLNNLFDRAFNDGAVVDFMNIGIGSLRTGIFNVADMAIMAGAFLMIFDLFRSGRQQEAH